MAHPPPHAPGGPAAADLRAKYEEMHALRLLAVGGAPHDPRPRMANLAARFPGALREMDALPLGVIESRLATLASVERGLCAAPSWVAAMHRFHALTRGVLFVKRAHNDEGVRVGPWPAEALEWREEVAHVASPPRGRLMELVFERLGRELGIEPAAAKTLVFSVDVDVDVELSLDVETV